MKLSAPVERDLVLIGGGHSHLAVIKGFGMHPIPGVRVSVISREVMTPYSGMVPGLMAGHYSYDEAHIDLQRLCQFSGTRLFHTAAAHVDFDRREVHCIGRPPVQFDLLSIDTGSTPDILGIKGAKQYAIPIKPIDEFLHVIGRLETQLMARPGPLRIVIVGGGAGGVELCLSLHHRFSQILRARDENAERLQLSIVSYGAELTPQHAKKTRKVLHDVLMQRGIKVRLLQMVTAIDADRVTLADGTSIECDTVILATHAAAPEWPAAGGIAVDARGFIRVRDTLQSVSHENLFAAGDVATIDGRQLAKSGVYAVRQGPVLHQNLRNLLNMKPLAPYHPQRRALSIISTGDKHAVASYGGYALYGSGMWRLKDRIDRRWMRKYQQLPEMPGLVFADAENSLHMRCGGCGAKVAADILQRALSKLTVPARPDIIIGLDTPDDAAVIALPVGKFLVQTVDHFRWFIDDPYLMGKITASHCLGDIHAMGAMPHSALAIVTLPFGNAEKLENDLSALLAGACEVLNREGAPLIGGHTGEGAELAFGLTINGVADPGSWLRKSGAKAGDVLILTKPLGTGALLAANMRAKAKAAWMQTAIAMMLQSSGAAAECLRAHGVTACTDVSGFGLLGHLGEMLRASETSADIQLDFLPVLDGAKEIIASGIVSTIDPANRRNAASLITGGEQARDHPNYGLLFDPQTAGGLLAAAPEDKSQLCVAALRDLGYTDAAMIGRVKAREGEESTASLQQAGGF